MLMDDGPDFVWATAVKLGFDPTREQCETVSSCVAGDTENEAVRLVMVDQIALIPGPQASVALAHERRTRRQGRL